MSEDTLCIVALSSGSSFDTEIELQGGRERGREGGDRRKEGERSKGGRGKVMKERLYSRSALSMLKSQSCVPSLWK